MTTTKHISLDVQRPNLIPSLSAKQYDSESRLIDVTVTEMGEAVEVSDSAVILFNIQKPDGSNASYNGSVNEDGTIHLAIPTWALDTNGVLLCSVSIIENDTRLSTLRFTIAVESAETLAEPSEDEKDVWAEALSDIAKMKPTVEGLISENNEILNAVGYNAKLYPTGRTYHSEYYAAERKDILSFTAFIVTADWDRDTDILTPIVSPFSEEAENLMVGDSNSVSRLLDQAEAYIKQVYPSAQIDKMCSYYKTGWADEEEHYVLAWEIRLSIRNLISSVFDELKEAFEKSVVDYFDNAEKYTWTVPPQAITKELTEI